MKVLNILTNPDDNVNDLVTFNAPSAALQFDEEKREEIRSLNPDAQMNWAHTTTQQLREKLVTTIDSVELANNNVADFCIALNTALSGEAWAILGYKSAEDYVKSELNMEQLGHVREARGEVARSLKSMGGFSNRVIASVLGVSHQTINKDIKNMPVQVATQLPPVHSASSGHRDQKSLSMDGKSYANKRDDKSLVRDFLEFSYLHVLKGRSLRDIEQETHTPFNTVKSVLDMADAYQRYDRKGEEFHNHVTQLFVKARRMQLDPEHPVSHGALALQLGISLEGLDFLLSPQGWSDPSYHHHSDSKAIVTVNHIVACMISPVSLESWVDGEGQADRSFLNMADESFSKTTVSEIAQIVGQKQSNISYHLSKLKRMITESRSNMLLDHALGFTPGQNTDSSESSSVKSTTPSAVQALTTHNQEGNASSGHDDQKTLSMDVLDTANGWTIVPPDVYNRMSSLQRLHMHWYEERRCESLTMQELVSNIGSIGRNLLDGVKDFKPEQARKIGNILMDELKAFMEIDDCISFIPEIMNVIPKSVKQDLLLSIEDRIASLTRLKDCIDNPDTMSTVMSHDTYQDHVDAISSEEDINDLMMNQW